MAEQLSGDETECKLRNAIKSNRTVLMLLLGGLLWGCAAASPRPVPQDTLVAGAILPAETATPIPFEALIDDLKKVQVIYVGESHTDPAHHEVQLKILKALFGLRPDLTVGMEMFDRSYQPVLDQWSAGLLDREDFIRKVHWQANWRYDYQLYAGILDFIRENRIRLVALNLPFHIPAKIRIGGLDSLPGCDRTYLPEEIDTTNSAHRAYLEEVFREHHGTLGAQFEFFYQAQCVWEEVMAESVAANLNGRMMIVLAGNGHIRKFGIPDRAFKRSGTAFRTVCPVPAGGVPGAVDADFIWVTPAPDEKMPAHERKM